jgi:hypothetical protein
VGDDHSFVSGGEVRIAALVAIAVVFAPVLAGCPPRGEGIDPSSVPPNLRADYELFAQRCSKCHSLARPLDSGITEDDYWRDYVTRMRRQPGSGISPADEEPILRFLFYYAAEQRKKRAGNAGDGG